MNTRWVWLFGLLAICLTACGAGESDTAGGTEADVHAGGDPQTDSGNDPQTDSSDDPQTDSSDDPQTEAGGDAQADAGAEPDSGTGVGELEWTLTIDVASDDDELRAVEVGADDDIVVGGCLTVYSASRHAQDLDAYVARFFETLDVNGDGQVTRSESPIIVRRRSFHRFDSNRDGYATRSELVKFAENLYPPSNTN